MADKEQDGGFQEQNVDEPDLKILDMFKKEEKSGQGHSSKKRKLNDDVEAPGGKGEVRANVPLNKDSKAILDKDIITYNMNHPNRGIAIIFNNKKFKCLPERSGTDRDAAAMDQILRKLGFQVHLYHSQTALEMRNITEKVAKFDHSKNDAFVMVILSHGNEQGVYGTDTVVAVEKLTNPLKGDKCPSLAGKPKLFFIQACRGSEYDKGVKPQSDFGLNKSQKIPTDADILIAYSVVPGHYSWRNQAKGSWFIQALSKVLEKYGETKEILWMMTRVNAIVAFDFESDTDRISTDGMKQIPAITSMLTKELYFRPKPN